METCPCQGFNGHQVMTLSVARMMGCEQMSTGIRELPLSVANTWIKRSLSDASCDLDGFRTITLLDLVAALLQFVELYASIYK